jgi:hypothetical protein
MLDASDIDFAGYPVNINVGYPMRPDIQPD